MTYLILAITVGGMLLYVLSFNPAWRPVTMGIAVAGGVLFLVGAGLWPLGVGLRSLWRGVASSRWPTVPGVVLKTGTCVTRAKEQGATNTYTFYSANLAFRYKVKGRDYTTETFRFGRALGSTDFSKAAVLLLRYPPGADVKIFYHPSDPSVAVVKPGVDSDVIWYLAGGLAFILLGVLGGLGYLSMVRDVHMFVRVSNLMWLFFVLFGVAMLTPGLENLWHAYASASWPVTKGVIVYAEQDASSRVTQDSEGDAVPSTTYGAPLAYRYQVDGTNYFSNVRHFGQFVASGEKWAKAIQERYPSGTDVPVRYCPTDPDLAALEPGIHSEACYLPGGGAAFLLAGLVGFLWSVLR